MRSAVFWGVLGYPWVSWGVLGYPGVSWGNQTDPVVTPHLNCLVETVRMRVTKYVLKQK